VKVAVTAMTRSARLADAVYLSDLVASSNSTIPSGVSIKATSRPSKSGAGFGSEITEVPLATNISIVGRSSGTS